MSLPIDRTNLTAAQTNQVPNQLLQSAKNIAALQTPYDTIDELYNYTSNLVAGGVLQPYPHGLSRQSLINPNFNGWQRGTSFSAPASPAYTADQWKVGWSSGGGTFPVLTHARQALTPGDIANAFYGYRITTDGSGTGLGTAFYQLTQPIEFGTRLLCGAGKKVTVSFWAKSSIAGKRIGIDLIQKYGTGGTPSADETINGNNFTLTSSWQKFSFTFTTNTLVGKSFGSNNDDHLLFEFWHVWGTTTQTRVGAGSVESFVGAGTIDIAQVSINAGDAALPFQPMSINDELIQWQRYYKEYGFGVLGTGTSTTTFYLFLVFPQKMRIAPTLILKTPNFALWDGVAQVSTTTGTLSMGANSDSGASINGGGFTVLTTYRPYGLNTASVFALDATL